MEYFKIDLGKATEDIGFMHVSSYCLEFELLFTFALGQKEPGVTK